MAESRRMVKSLNSGRPPCQEVVLMSLQYVLLTKGAVGRGRRLATRRSLARIRWPEHLPAGRLLARRSLARRLVGDGGWRHDFAALAFAGRAFALARRGGAPRHGPGGVTIAGPGVPDRRRGEQTMIPWICALHRLRAR